MNKEPKVIGYYCAKCDLEFTWEECKGFSDYLVFCPNCKDCNKGLFGGNAKPFILDRYETYNQLTAEV